MTTTRPLSSPHTAGQSRNMFRDTGYHEITLVVRYHGLKATQYFSKWTQESDRVFREDLTALRLPHPKRESTTFVSFGCIQAVWPSVPKHGVIRSLLAFMSSIALINVHLIHSHYSNKFNARYPMITGNARKSAQNASCISFFTRSVVQLLKSSR